MLSNNFWKKITHVDTCWIWNGYIDKDGYGRYKHEGKNYFTHRLAYLTYSGEIPQGLEIDHLCRNRNCCNPDHLEAVTHKENILRGESPSAINGRKAKCPKGHDYTNETKGRRCLTCQSQYKKQYYLMTKEDKRA